MKQYLRLTAFATAMILILSGCGKRSGGPEGFGGPGGPGGMPMQGQAAAATAVRTQNIELASISNEYMYSGSIEPSDEVNVYSALSGKVATVNFDVGDEVNAGDVLFTMDTTSIENNIRSAEANIKISEAGVNSAKISVNTAEDNLNMANGASMQTQLENAKNAITNAENSLTNAQTAIDNAQIAVDNAKINLDKAENDYNVNLQLYEVGGISEEAMNNSRDAYEQAKNTYSQAQLALVQANNQYASAEDSLKQAQTNYDILANQTSQENILKAQDSLEQSKAQLNSSQAQLESSRVQLENSKKSLEDAVVTSPISGIVSQRNVTAGASLSQGTSPFVIINTNSVDIKVNIAEQMINSIKQGDSVRINVPTFSDEDFNGRISSISPQANNDGTYEVKVNVPNSDGSLTSGMFAEVYFTKEKSDNAIVIPRDCIITKDGESYVFAVEDAAAKKYNVVIGIDNGDTVEITEGLKAGMTIVTEGQTYLADGDAVNDVTNKAANDAANKAENAQLNEKNDNRKQSPPVPNEGKR